MLWLLESMTFDHPINENGRRGGTFIKGPSDAGRFDFPGENQKNGTSAGSSLATKRNWETIREALDEAPFPQ